MYIQVCSNHDPVAINWAMPRGQIEHRPIQENDFKYILLVNYKCQSFNISYEASLGHRNSSWFK